MKRKSLKTIYARREFCSPDVLLRYILRQVESSPAATFSESELVHVSKSSFQVLKQQCLQYIQRDPEKEVYFDKEGNERAVRKINGKWIAASTDDPEIAPIQLTEKDLTRHSFNIQPLLAEIKARNNLIKNVDQITPRVHFVGEKMVLGNSVGVFVAFLGDDAQAEAELLGLRSKIDTFDNILVLCPSFVISSQALLNRLAGQNIVCLPFGKKGYTIDFSKARFKREIEQGVPRLTAEQHADYSTHGYKCFDKINIPGTKPRKRSNNIEVNGHKIKVPDEVFPLLIKLVVKLKSGKGGWIVQSAQADNYHIYERLKKPIEGSLLKKNARDFLENDGSKGWRLSVHPDFVTYDRDQLLRNYSGTVKDFAKKLPKK